MAVGVKPSNSESGPNYIKTSTTSSHHDMPIDNPNISSKLAKQESRTSNGSGYSRSIKPSPQTYDFTTTASERIKKGAYNDDDIRLALLKLDTIVMGTLGASVDEKTLGDGVCTLEATAMKQQLKDECNNIKDFKRPRARCPSCKTGALVIDGITEKHKKELILAKQETIIHVHKILKWVFLLFQNVSKYRQVAMEAVEVAKSQQQQFLVERQRLYVEAYEACEIYRERVSNQQQVGKRVGGNKEKNCNQELHRLNSGRSASVQDICTRLARGFKCDKFNADFIADCKTKIKDSYTIFQDELMVLLVESFMHIKCNLTRRDAKELIDAVLFKSESCF